MRCWWLVTFLFILASCGERLSEKMGSGGGGFRGTGRSGRSGFGIPPLPEAGAPSAYGGSSTRFKLSAIREVSFSQSISLKPQSDTNGTIAVQRSHHAFLFWGRTLYDVNALKNAETVFCALSADSKELKAGRYEVSDSDVGEEWASAQLKVLHWKKMELKGARATLYCGFFSDVWRNEGLDVGQKFSDKAVRRALGTYADYSPSGTTGK